MRHIMAALIIALAGAPVLASNIERIPPPETLNELMEMSSNSQGDALDQKQVLRDLTVRKVAALVGAQQGYVWRMREYLTDLENNADFYDQLFDFKSLMVSAGRHESGEVSLYRLPGVVQRARDRIDSNGGSILKRTKESHKIIQPVKLVVVPPTWREYLISDIDGGTNKPSRASLPQNDHEKAIWKEEVQAGWTRGVDQADLEMEVRIQELRTDFVGMIIFLQGQDWDMINDETVAVDHEMVAGDSNTLDIDTTLYQITSPARFNIRAREWKAGELDPRDSLLSDPGVSLPVAK